MGGNSRCLCFSYMLILDIEYTSLLNLYKYNTSTNKESISKWAILLQMYHRLHSTLAHSILFTLFDLIIRSSNLKSSLVIRYFFRTTTHQTLTTYRIFTEINHNSNLSIYWCASQSSDTTTTFCSCHRLRLSFCVYTRWKLLKKSLSVFSSMRWKLTFSYWMFQLNSYCVLLHTISKK